MMMKIKQKTVLWLAAAILAAVAAAWGGLWLFAGQSTVPRGVTVGGLPLGGIGISEAVRLLDERQTALLDEPVILQSKGLTIQTSWKKIGAQISSANFVQALETLKQGNIWTRARHRWQFQKSWSLEAGWSPDALKKTLNSDWEAKQFGSLKNAQRIIDAGDRIRYVPEITAPRIDWDVLSSRIHAKLPRSFSAAETADDGVAIDLPLKTTSPPVTVQSLKAQGIDRRIAIVTTSLRGSSGRIHNVDAAASIIDGMVLAPGEIFDYAKIVEQAKQKYGFREAPVIVNGKLVPGIGGGICQVSGTLYGAVIRAGLEIVERRNHSRPVSYLPKGQDATFSTGYINFRFKNNTNTYVQISAASTGGTFVVKLFGTMPQNMYYQIQSKTVKVINPPVRYISNPSLPKGASQLLQSGTPGSVVETYRMKWVNGKKAGEELLSRDTYPAQPSLVAVRSASASPGEQLTPKQPDIVEDGVSETGGGGGN